LAVDAQERQLLASGGPRRCPHGPQNRPSRLRLRLGAWLENDTTDSFGLVSLVLIFQPAQLLRASL
jgi:hypothetical protein